MKIYAIMRSKCFSSLMPALAAGIHVFLAGRWPTEVEGGVSWTVTANG
jgi:hypothetical protein